MSGISNQIIMKTYNDYSELVKHPFAQNIFEKARAILHEIRDPKTGFKIDTEYKRTPTEYEYYLIGVGQSLAHLFSIIQQMEHTILYFSAFSPTKRMDEAGINRHSHLLWAIENYIIRTKSFYDRLLILIDRVFDFQNEGIYISHSSIVSNKHIKLTDIPGKVRPIKKALKKYYNDRNTIIHEQTYLDEELRKIEGLTLILDNDEIENDDLKEELQFYTRKYVKKKTQEFSRTNIKLCQLTSELFESLYNIYKNKSNL